MNFQTFDRSDFFFNCLEKKLLRFKIRIFFWFSVIPIWELEKKSDAHLGNDDSYLGTYNKIYDSWMGYK